MLPLTKTYWRWTIGVLFIAAGTNHFLNPTPYLAMMPDFLPWHRGLVFASGVAEVFGGIGVLIRSVRSLAAWGLIVLLIAVFPANLEVARHGWPGVDLPTWVLWLRLPLQPLLIWWIYATCLARGSGKGSLGNRDHRP